MTLFTLLPLVDVPPIQPRFDAPWMAGLQVLVSYVLGTAIVLAFLALVFAIVALLTRMLPTPLAPGRASTSLPCSSRPLHWRASVACSSGSSTSTSGSNMPRVLRWCLGGVLAVVLSFTGAGAATAATSPAPTHVASATAAAAAEDGTVEGETWSSPAVPVKCTRSGGTVSCTPESSSSSVAMTCYLDVPLGGETVTVCSSSKESQTALERGRARSWTTSGGARRRGMRAG